MKKKDESYIFYSIEWTEILNSLLKFFPYSLAFKLSEIQKNENINHDKYFTELVSNGETTYKSISEYLVYNDFAKVANEDYIILTDKGRQLIKAGNYKDYIKLEQLKKDVEIRELKIKKHYFWIEFGKILISILFGFLLSFLKK